MLTGESVPIDKGIGDEAIGGSVNGEGSLTISIKKTGEGTYLSQVIKLVKEAQESKSKAQDLANRAAKWLFYGALFAGLLTFIIWNCAWLSRFFCHRQNGYSPYYCLPSRIRTCSTACRGCLYSNCGEEWFIDQKPRIRNRASFENARLLVLLKLWFLIKLEL